AVAAIVYVAIRSGLRSEVDRSLQSTAQQLVREPDGGRGGPGGGPGGPPHRPPSDDRPGEVPHAPPAAFGGAAGYVQLVGPDGVVSRAPGETPSLPVHQAARAIAASGTGADRHGPTVHGPHPPVPTMGAGA